MANKTYSVSRILTDLNRGLATPEWEIVPNVFSLSEVRIENQGTSNTGNSLVFKVFVNLRTNEIKLYLAKFLDEVPETADLP